MNLINDLLNILARWIRPHLRDVCTALVACLLVLYGEDINRWISRKIKVDQLLFRIAIFVAICAFGYGILSVALSALFQEAFLYMDRRLMAPAVLAAFLVVGFIAQRRRHI